MKLSAQALKDKAKNSAEKFESTVAVQEIYKTICLKGFWSVWHFLSIVYWCENRKWDKIEQKVFM
jgi:hypothetical protein